jgi:hypothetical protein
VDRNQTVSEEKALYRVWTKPVDGATLDIEQLPIPVDPAHLERILIPLLNWARQAQGKRPVILPKG